MEIIVYGRIELISEAFDAVSRRCRDEPWSCLLLSWKITCSTVSCRCSAFVRGTFHAEVNSPVDSYRSRGQ